MSWEDIHEQARAGGPWYAGITWHYIAMAVLVLLTPAVRNFLPPDQFFTFISLLSAFMGLWALGWIKHGNRRKGPSPREHHRKHGRTLVFDYMKSNFLYERIYQGILMGALVLLLF